MQWTDPQSRSITACLNGKSECSINEAVEPCKKRPLIRLVNQYNNYDSSECIISLCCFFLTSVSPGEVTSSTLPLCMCVGDV